MTVHKRLLCIFIVCLLIYFYELTSKTNYSVCTHLKIPPIDSENRNKSHQVKELKLQPNISLVFMNLGSNLDPIIPPLNYSTNSVTIAFEPIVAFRIPKHPLLIVVPAAISTDYGLTSMYSYNDNGLSSSLSLPMKETSWNTGRDEDGSLHIVASLTLRQILLSMPKTIKRIPYLKTDLQGYDWSIINHTGKDLSRFPVDYLYSEVYFDQVTTYKNVKNDFCVDWMPTMSKLGYELIFVDTPEKNGMLYPEALIKCANQNEVIDENADIKEGNALWKRIGANVEYFEFQSI